MNINGSNKRCTSVITLLLFFIFLSSIVYSIENCEDVTSPDKIPCYVLLPYNGNCSNLNVSFYYNSTQFLNEKAMSNYTNFQCSSLFNYSQIGTYSWKFSTGDSGNLVLEVGNMNLLIYGILLALIVIFITLMHKTKDVEGSSFIYSGIAGIISFIMATMLFLGVKFLDGITLVVDINYYFAVLMLLFGIYCFVVTYNLVLDYNSRYSKSEENYY